MLVICMSACDQDISIKTNNTGADTTKLTFQCIDNMSYAVSINGSFAQIKDSIGRYKTCDRDRKGRPLLWPEPGESMSAWRKRLEAYDKETPKVPKVGAYNSKGQIWTGKRWL